MYQQSMQHFVTAETNLHERGLLAVKSVSQPPTGGRETSAEEIILHVLRGLKSPESIALTGSEAGLVFGVAWTSFA